MDEEAYFAQIIESMWTAFCADLGDHAAVEHHEDGTVTLSHWGDGSGMDVPQTYFVGRLADALSLIKTQQDPDAA